MKKVSISKDLPFFTAFFCVLMGIILLVSMANSQEDTGPPPCPHPYIKLIKPKLAKPGTQVIIRGRRFRDQDESSDVVFTPGLSGKIIFWRNTKIKVEVPPGARTGSVVVKTKCATSNEQFFKVAAEEGEKKE